MVLYIFTLVGGIFLSYLTSRFDKDTKQRKLLLFLTIVFLVLISGFRLDETMYSDEWNYRHIFEDYLNTPITSLELSLFNEPAFKLLNWFLASRGFEAQSLIFITAAFTVSVYVIFIHKYSIDFQLAMYIFIAGGTYFSMMNIVRQYIAIAIVLMGYHWIIEKKLFRFVPFVFIASLFHISAWIALLYYFILNIRKVERSVFLLLVIGAVAIINFSELIEKLDMTVYAEYATSYEESGYGVGWMRIIFWGTFAVFVFIKRKRIFESSNIQPQIMNGYYLSTILLFSSRLYVYINRLDYTGICNCILISLVPNAFSRRNYAFVKLLIMAVFFAYGYYQVVYIGGYANMRNLIFAFI